MKQRACWYNLTTLTKDERQMIYKKLNRVDWILLQIAYNEKYESMLNYDQFIYNCTINGYLDIIYWTGFSKKICLNAITNGHLNILMATKLELFSYFYKLKLHNQAAMTGQLQILQWLHSKEPCNKTICFMAAKHGQLHILQWLRFVGVPWDENICSTAAYNGHLHIIQWARANGAPWNSQVYHRAVLRRNVEMIQWCVENGAPMDGELIPLY